MIVMHWNDVLATKVHAACDLTTRGFDHCRALAQRGWFTSAFEAAFPYITAAAIVIIIVAGTRLVLRERRRAANKRLRLIFSGAQPHNAITPTRLRRAA